MALAKRWSLTFKSLNNTTCNVYIYDDGWEGAVTELTGAADPFYYEEDNDESLLTVLRYRTGYIRVVEKYYNELTDLYPTSSTSRYVEFYYGERLDFTGYLQSQNFQEEWVASPRILEFPVISPLGLSSAMKFSRYTTPTYITLGACLYNIITRFNSYANDDSKYQRVVFPDCSPELSGYINTMVICGFNKEFSHADPDSQVFEPEYFSYLLEGICNAYGWILHDTPEALIFTRYDWDGNYAYYDLSYLSVPTNKTTITDVNGSSLLTLLNSFSVCDADANESIIQPLKSLEISYEGDVVDTVSMEFPHTYTDNYQPGGQFGFDENPEYISGVVWLKTADGEWGGTHLNDTNSRNALDIPVNPGCNLTYSGSGAISYQERILIGWSTTWNDNVELFRWTSYNPPVGDAILEMNISWGEKISTLGNEARENPIVLDVWAMSVYGSTTRYYNKANGGWAAPSPGKITLTFDEQGQCKTTIKDIPQGLFTLVFIVNTTTGAQMTEVISIDSMTVSRRTQIFPEYTIVQNETDTITGSDVGMETGSVELSINCYRQDTHLINSEPVSEKFTEYPYLFTIMNRVECKFRAVDYDLLNIYLAKWKFWINHWRWRIISVSFEPWNDSYNIVLHRSSAIESHSYLADSSDNVFESLDDYLFTVVSD